MVKRNLYILKNVIEVEEFLDGRYGAPGEARVKKKKATPEQVEKVNQYNREKKARRKLRLYFEIGQDWFVTLTYRKDARPPDLKTAVKQFGRFRRIMAREYKKRELPFYWIRNIENTPTGNWHIHLVLNDIPNVNILVLLKKAWPHGRVKDPQQLYEKGELSALAAYITKNEKTKREYVPDGVLDHRITEASYNTSKNMPLPPPKTQKLKRWREEPYVRKGYYIDQDSYFEGTNKVTGYNYRHYTMVRLVRRE